MKDPELQKLFEAIFIEPKKCCMNCDSFYVSDVGFCSLDNEKIPETFEHFYYCEAFSMWWGAVE